MQLLLVHGMSQTDHGTLRHKFQQIGNGNSGPVDLFSIGDRMSFGTSLVIEMDFTGICTTDLGLQFQSTVLFLFGTSFGALMLVDVIIVFLCISFDFHQSTMTRNSQLLFVINLHHSQGPLGQDNIELNYVTENLFLLYVYCAPEFPLMWGTRGFCSPESPQ